MDKAPRPYCLLHQNGRTLRVTGEVRRLEEALRAAGFAGDPLGFLLSTPCVLAVINQEDLSGELEQQNLPGSTWQYPNWRRKMLVTVEDIAPLAKHFAEAAQGSGRGPG